MGNLNTRDFFDRASTDWDQKITHNEDKIAQYLNYIDFNTKLSVLDVGTGTGIMLKFMLPKLPENARITAVDLSSKMLEKAQQNFKDPRIAFKQLDIEKEHHLLEQYDFIMLYSVFPHLEEKNKIFKILSRCLKQNGELCIMHSSARKEINEMHKSLGEPVCNHQLPPVTKLQALGEKHGLRTLAALEEENGYFFLGSLSESS